MSLKKFRREIAIFLICCMIGNPSLVSFASYVKDFLFIDETGDDFFGQLPGGRAATDAEAATGSELEPATDAEADRATPSELKPATPSDIDSLLRYDKTHNMAVRWEGNNLIYEGHLYLEHVRAEDEAKAYPGPDGFTISANGANSQRVDAYLCSFTTDRRGLDGEYRYYQTDNGGPLTITPAKLVDKEWIAAGPEEIIADNHSWSFNEEYSSSSRWSGTARLVIYNLRNTSNVKIEKIGLTYGLTTKRGEGHGQFYATADISSDIAEKSKVNAYFNGNGGSSPTSITLPIGEALGPLPTSIRTGYIFEGWFTEANGGTQISENTVLTANTTFYAHWKPISYSIRFNANGGQGLMNNCLMTYDTSKNLPANTYTRQAYLFDGWATNLDGTGTVYMDGQSLRNLTTSNGQVINLYARWKLNECTISYDGNGGESPLSTKKVICKTDIGAASLPQASRTGYTFLGWSLDKNRPDQLLTANSQFETINVTAYAQWKPNAYTITFDPKGGSLTNTLKNVYYDKPIGNLPEPQMHGKAFTGWVRSDKSARAGSVPISESTVLREEGMSCVATYSSSAYTLSYNGNGGSCTVPAVSRAYNQAIGDLPAASRPGYLLKGWFTEREGGNQMNSSSGMPAYDLALYAHWYPITHTIRFDANGGTGSMVPQHMTYDVGKELTANQYTNVDHKFTGWNTKQDGTGTSYKDTAPVINLTQKDGAEVVLYAQWKRTGALCTFYDWNNSLLGTATFEVGTSIQYGEPARAGYTFAGWEGIGGAPLHNITEPGSYRATYRINRYKVLFKDDTKQFEIEQEYGQPLGTLPVTEREGHTFLGWFTEKEGGTEITDATLMPLGGVTGYARFEANRYTLTFHYNGGSEDIISLTAEYGKPVGALPQSTKTGCVFSGWNVQADIQGQFVDENFKMPAKNMDVYAAWDISKVLCIFLDDNGIEVERLSIPYGGNANPATPVKKGYLFTAWDKSLNNIKDKTVFAASFTPVSYTIVFDVNGEMYPGAVGSMEAVPATYDKIARLPESNYMQDHFRFTGWKQDREGKGNLIVDKANTINLSALDKDVVTLYAQFSRTESLCRFEDWDGRYIQNELIPYGEDAVYSGIPERAGYTFTGWSPVTKNITEPSVFTAVYRPNTYEVTFMTNGGTGSMEQQSFTYDVSAALFANQFQKDFYVFKGWNSKADGSGEPYPDGQTVMNLTALDKADVTLYAQWGLLYLDGENNTHVRPGPDKTLGTEDDEKYFNGPDGKPGTSDDKLIHPGEDGDSYIENGDGTITRPGPDGIYGTDDDEDYFTGPDGKPGTDDDKIIHPGENGDSYIENGDGTHTRPGPDGIYGTDDDEDYWNGPDGKPGTSDDKLIHPGENGDSYIENEDGTVTRPGPDGIYGTDDDEDYWNGPDGKPGTGDDKLIHPGENGDSSVDNGNGTITRPGADGIYGTDDDENYWEGPDGKPGTGDDKLILPGKDGIYGTDDDYYYDESGNKVYPGSDGIFGTVDDIIEKPKRGSGGGGGSSGGSGGFGLSGGSGVLPIEGQWTQHEINGQVMWSFTDVSGSLQTGWAFIKNPYAAVGQPLADWFCFDTNGYMVTGWYQDQEGLWYYLNEKSDGTLGRMMTGWYLDEKTGKWYFFSQAHDGRFGHAVKGWNVIEGKSYYFSEEQKIQPYMIQN